MVLTTTTRFRDALLVSALLAALATGGERLPIENAAMDPRIHPVAPEDGAPAVTNPPSMVFWHTGAARAYVVEIARQKDFADAIVARGIELPMYNHSQTLATGRWYWRYYYKTKDKQAARAFTARVRGRTEARGIGARKQEKTLDIRVGGGGMIKMKQETICPVVSALGGVNTSPGRRP